LSTGERGWWEHTSAGDPGVEGVPDGTDGGVLASLAAGLPFAEGERSRLMPLLPSIVEKLRSGEGNPKHGRDKGKKWEMVLGGERMRYL
jgi:hypothetical protein